MRISPESMMLTVDCPSFDGNAMAYVTLSVGDAQIGASVTRAALDDLQINNGDRVTAVFKATEVMLQKAYFRCWPRGAHLL